MSPLGTPRSLRLAMFGSQLCTLMHLRFAFLPDLSRSRNSFGWPDADEVLPLPKVALRLRCWTARKWQDPSGWLLLLSLKEKKFLGQHLVSPLLAFIFPPYRLVLGSHSPKVEIHTFDVPGKVGQEPQINVHCPSSRDFDLIATTHLTSTAILAWTGNHVMATGCRI
jgi:hypothetical protein